jgi:hypothetical protein
VALSTWIDVKGKRFDPIDLVNPFIIRRIMEEKILPDFEISSSQFGDSLTAFTQAFHT